MIEYELEIIYSEREISETVARLGQEITKSYFPLEKELLVVGLLKGSFIFMSDLVRKIELPLSLDFLTVSSYGDRTESSGNVKIIMDLDVNIENKHILMVEDIIDTGYTLDKVLNYLKSKNPASIKICTLLDKPSRREVEIAVDFKGFEVPDKFVCGYGLDYAQKLRNLPYVAELKL